MKSAVIIIATTLITYAVLKLLLSPLSEVKFSSSILAPFGTVVEKYCTDTGVEYLVTNRGYMVLHVSPAGNPVICATFQPLAGK